MKKFMLALLVLGVISCHPKNDLSYKEPIDLNDGLSVSTLEKHQLDSSVFNRVNKDICQGKYGNMHSLLILVDNELVVEQYYNGWERDRLHFLASNTKSVTSFLIGKAIEQAWIKDVNQKVLCFFPEYAAKEKDSLKHEICIHNLLTMTSGLQWDAETQLADLQRSNDRLDFALTLPMDTIPGTKYEYCSPNCIILSEIIRKKLEQPFVDFAEKNLFAPIGDKGI